MDNLNNISYADNWKEAYTPVYHNNNETEYETEKTKEIKKHKKKKTNLPIILIIQLVLCAMIVLSGFIIKFIGGDLYTTLHNWYYDNLNNEIFITEDFKSVDIDDIFN